MLLDYLNIYSITPSWDEYQKIDNSLAKLKYLWIVSLKHLDSKVNLGKVLPHLV